MRSCETAALPMSSGVKREKIMKIQIQIAMLLVYFFIVPSNGMAADNNNSGWSYYIRNGIEESKRSYLLVFHPGRKEQKQINVVTTCSKNFDNDGVYGICNHDIFIEPEKQKLLLNTGEDVVVSTSNFDFLIIGTISYGCCALADTIKFYTENGLYLGRLYGLDISKGRNTITDTIDLRNHSRNSRRGRSENIDFFVVQDDNDDLKYSAWVKEPDDKSQMRKIPIIFNMSNKDTCEEWYLTNFVRYYDRKDITFTLEGRFCEKQERTFNCQMEEDKINCTPSQ